MMTLKPITNENKVIFSTMMKDYAKELDENQNRSTDPTRLSRWTDNIINKAYGSKFCVVEMCYTGDDPIGFLYAKIDQPDDVGYIRIGQGYIMEFYVKPEHRRKGCGRFMFNYIEQFFVKQGINHIYLTTDPVSGKPFWSAMGFISKGEYSSDNKLEILEKNI